MATLVQTQLKRGEEAETDPGAQSYLNQQPSHSAQHSLVPPRVMAGVLRFREGGAQEQEKEELRSEQQPLPEPPIRPILQSQHPSFLLDLPSAKGENKRQ